jgi:hypothetical protein
MRPKPEIAGSNTIHPQFERALADLTAEFALAEGQLRALAQEAKAPLRSLHAYLDFEIGKTELKLKEMRPDETPEDFTDTQVWLKVLKDLRAEFPAEGIEAGADFLDRLLQRLWTAFEDDSEDEKRNAELLED